MHVGQKGNPVVSWRSLEARESPKDMFSCEADYRQRGRNREGVSVMNSVDQDVLQVLMQFIQKDQKETFILHS